MGEDANCPQLVGCALGREEAESAGREEEGPAEQRTRKREAPGLGKGDDLGRPEDGKGQE